MYGLIKIAEQYPKEQLPPILGGATRPPSPRKFSHLEELAIQDGEIPYGMTYEEFQNYTNPKRTAPEHIEPERVSVLNMTSEELAEHSRKEQEEFDKLTKQWDLENQRRRPINQAPNEFVPPPRAKPIHPSQIDFPESEVKSALRESNVIAHRNPMRSAVGYGLAGAGLAGLGVAAYKQFGKGE